MIGNHVLKTKWKYYPKVKKLKKNLILLHWIWYGKYRECEEKKNPTCRQNIKEKCKRKNKLIKYEAHKQTHHSDTLTLHIHTH